jgi:hypothetical protein
VDGGVVVSVHELTGARAAMVARFSTWRESEEGGRNEGSNSVSWRLEGRRGLTSGATVHTHGGNGLRLIGHQSWLL